MVEAVRSREVDLSSGAKHVVVCGAGVIGACTAYYLGQMGFSVTIIEREGIACAASGKSGGFLARDWCDGGPMGALMQLSFRLHSELQDSLGVDYGYRRLDTLSVQVALPQLKDQGSVNHGGNVVPEEARGGGAAAAIYLADERDASLGEQETPAWLDRSLGAVGYLGSTQTTAQVHPKLFTEAVMAAAVHKFGVNLVLGEVKDVRLEGNNVRGVQIENGRIIEADAVVLCMGPWTGKLSIVKDNCVVKAVIGHSVIVRPKNKARVTPHALFVNLRGLRGAEETEVDVFPRPTGEVYVCGINSEVTIPEDNRGVVPLASAFKKLRQVANAISVELESGDLLAEQACLRPFSSDGNPIIGRIPGIEGAFIGSGHGFWGITNAPATGLALAELVRDGHCRCLNLKPFDPARFVDS